MCLSIPAEIVALGKRRAKVKQAGHYHWVDTALIRQGVNKGDFVICYKNVAFDKISPKEAKKILRLVKNDT